LNFSGVHNSDISLLVKGPILFVSPENN